MNFYSSYEKTDSEETQEYRNLVTYARNRLLDYYGTACPFSPAAYGDLVRINNMSPDEILHEARKNGLI